MARLTPANLAAFQQNNGRLPKFSITKYFQDSVIESRMTTFVLVPGAWLGGWVWKKVVPLLEDKGQEAFVVTLMGEGERVHLASKVVGIETAIQDVLNIIEYNNLNYFVLIGHSFAGKVAAAVGRSSPRKGGLAPLSGCVSAGEECENTARQPASR